MVSRLARAKRVCRTWRTPVTGIGCVTLSSRALGNDPTKLGKRARRKKLSACPVVFTAGDVLQELGVETRTYDTNDVHESPDQKLAELVPERPFEIQFPLRSGGSMAYVSTESPLSPKAPVLPSISTFQLV